MHAHETVSPDIHSLPFLLSQTKYTVAEKEKLITKC